MNIGRSTRYAAIHYWINRNFPRVGRCEWCGRVDRKTEYASARHDVYTHNRADWFEFCRPCHRAFDGVPVAQAARMTGTTVSQATRAKIAATLAGNTNKAGKYQTTCKRGHDLTNSANLKWNAKRGTRECRSCIRLRSRKD
jgi:hypothetical protein